MICKTASLRSDILAADALGAQMFSSIEAPFPTSDQQGPASDLNWFNIPLKLCFLRLALLPMVALDPGGAQNRVQYVPVSAACNELNVAALAAVRNGRIDNIHSAILGTSESDSGSAEPSCAGIILANVASFSAELGRFADAETFAEKAVHILEKAYPRDDSVLLPALQTLAAVRLEQGKNFKAGEAYARMRSLRIERLEQRAIVHGVGAALLQRAGRYRDAEAEYRAALETWEVGDHGRTADVAEILTALATVQLEQHHFAEARQALDRALNILNTAKDAVPNDRVILLSTRAALQARQRRWMEAQQDLHEALTIADLHPDAYVLRFVLANYARVLSRNHQRAEARVIKARLAALRREYPEQALVDVTVLLAKAKHTAH